MNRYNVGSPYIILLVCLSLQSCAVWHKSSNITNTVADIQQAETAFMSGDYSQSTELYKSLLIRDSQNEDLLFRYAESLRISGNIALAVEQYNKLSKEDLNNLNAIEGRGLAYLQQGDVDKALAEFNYVIGKDATRWRTLNAIAVAHSMSGKDKKAMKFYDIALAVSEGNPSIINNIAIAVALSGDANKGINLLLDALSRMDVGDKGKLRLENNLALLYGISGKMKKAEKILRKSLSEAAVYNNLGFYAKIAANKKLAWNYFGKAVSLSPVYYEKAENNMEDLGKPLKEYVNNSSKYVKKLARLKVRRGRYGRPLPIMRPE